MAKVTKAVALGDLSKQIEVDARGEILDLKNTVNGMVVRYVCLFNPKQSPSRLCRMIGCGHWRLKSRGLRWKSEVRESWAARRMYLMSKAYGLSWCET
jgi:hypothetical protein